MSKSFLIVVSLIIAVPGFVGAQDTLARKEIRKQKANFLLSDRSWTIEVPLWLPGYAGSFAYGDVDIEGEDGVDPENPIEPPEGIGGILSRLFSDEWYLKFFFLTKIAYENNRFLVQADVLTGSVGESVKFKSNNQEIVQAHYRTTDIRLFGGYKVVDIFSKNAKFRYELIGYLGARIHLNKIYAEFFDSSVILDITPSWAEPIIGLQNQFTWKRWFIVIQGDYGGYFVNSKYSTNFLGYVYYRTGKLNSVKLGWQHLNLNHKGTFLNEEYHITATFSGPSVALVFHF